MDVIWEIIIPVLGFVLAIVGAWDKLSIGFKFFSHKRSQTKLKLAEFELEQVEKYNSSAVYLVAYEFKQLFLIIIVLLAVMLVNSSPILVDYNDPKWILNAHLVLCWFAGFFSGRAMQAVNYVLKKEKLKAKNEAIVERLSVQVEQRT